MTDFSVTPPVRYIRPQLGGGVEVALLHLHEPTDHVVDPQCRQNDEVHPIEQPSIDVRHPHREDGEAQHVDQTEGHAQSPAVDQHDQCGDGQEHEDEQCDVHPHAVVITRLLPVDQDCRVNEGQQCPRTDLVQVRDLLHFSPLIEDDRLY